MNSQQHRLFFLEAPIGALRLLESLRAFLELDPDLLIRFDPCLQELHAQITLDLHLEAALTEAESGTLQPSRIRSLRYQADRLAGRITEESSDDMALHAPVAMVERPRLMGFFIDDDLPEEDEQPEVAVGLWENFSQSPTLAGETICRDLPALLALTAGLRRDLDELESEACEYFPARRAYLEGLKDV